MRIKVERTKQGRSCAVRPTEPVGTALVWQVPV